MARPCRRNWPTQRIKIGEYQLHYASHDNTMNLQYLRLRGRGTDLEIPVPSPMIYICSIRPAPRLLK